MKLLFSLATSVCLFSCVADAHEGHHHEPNAEFKQRIAEINTQPKVCLTASGRIVREATDRPEVADHFEPFEKSKNELNRIKLNWDKNYLYVESRGMPDHEMMTGIRAWQQQVPLPQNYTGSNAWRIPLNPTPAKTKLSAKENFFRGAIALAVNGVPIFNPIKNDGRTDTFLAGELDQWGGHCGRGDDYHYHVAPVHLEKLVGVGKPVAVALDGYLIYGYNDPNGKPPIDLDRFNGHAGPDGKYHYHATKKYPYLNGGFHGKVTIRNGQVDPQPRAQPLRPATSPLRGAQITGFENPVAGQYVLKYQLRGANHSIKYTIAADGAATFQFNSPQGSKTEQYTPRQNRERDARSKPDRPQGDRPPPRRRNRNDDRRKGPPRNSG